MTLITVVIPVYNSERYLRQCVESVLAQTFSDWEIILVEDCSTDNSALICSEFASLDRRIRVLCHSENRGLSVSRNDGIAESHGEWIFFLDSDDLLHPEALKLMLSATKLDCDLVCADFQKFDEDVEFRKVKDDFRIESSEEYLEKALYQRGANTSACGKLYHRNLLSKETFTPGILYEDLMAVPSIILKSNRVAVLKAKLYLYRQHAGSIIHTFTEARLGVLNVTDTLLREISISHPLLIPALRDRRFAAHFNILLLLYANRLVEPSTITRCLDVIKKERLSSLLNRRVRLKNRIGAALSILLGTKMLCRLIGSLNIKNHE